MATLTTCTMRLLGALTVVLALVFGASSAHAQRTTPLSLDTPRQTLDEYLTAGAAGDFELAATALDLRLIRTDTRKTRGVELAEQLYVVLRRAVWIDLDAVPDEPTLQSDAVTFRVTTVPLGGRDVPLTLTVVTSGRSKRWVWSASTVTLIPQLYDQYGPGMLESRLPPKIARLRFGRLAVWQWAGIAFALPLGYVLGRLAAFLAHRSAKRVTKRTRAGWDEELVDELRGPMRLFAGLVAFRVLIEPLTLPAATIGMISTLLKVAFIGVLGLAAMRVTTIISKAVETRATETAEMNESVTRVLRARGVATQVRVLRRVLNITIGVLVLAMMLLQFETVRNVGVSLLASAGLAGVIFGLAMQRTIGSLVAGVHLSATQPIRIGDEVVVEKEWGVIEEITLTYVVVRIWDERRLIVPMTRFFEQPFENWTKVGAQIHGTVMLYADPALPVSALRDKLDALVTDDPLWDGRTKRVQVTDADERSMTLRVLISGKSAGDVFALRAKLREELLSWLASFEGGRYMVRVRVEQRGGEGLGGAITSATR